MRSLQRVVHRLRGYVSNLSDAYGCRQSQKLPCAFWLKTRTKRIDQIDAPKQQGRCIVQAQTGLGGFTDKSCLKQPPHNLST